MSSVSSPSIHNVSDPILTEIVSYVPGRSNGISKKMQAAVHQYLNWAYTSYMQNPIIHARIERFPGFENMSRKEVVLQLVLFYNAYYAIHGIKPKFPLNFQPEYLQPAIQDIDVSLQMMDVDEKIGVVNRAIEQGHLNVALEVLTGSLFQAHEVYPILKQIIQQGHLEMVDTWLARMSPRSRGNVVQQAIEERDSVTALTVLKSGSISLKGDGINALIFNVSERGDQAVLSELLKMFPISEGLRDSMVQNAAERGDLGVVRILLQNDSITDNTRGESVARAARGGHAEVIKLLLENGSVSKFYLDIAIDRARSEGHRRLVPMLRPQDACCVAS